HRWSPRAHVSACDRPCHEHRYPLAVEVDFALPGERCDRLAPRPSTCAQAKRQAYGRAILSLDIASAGANAECDRDVLYQRRLRSAASLLRELRDLDRQRHSSPIRRTDRAFACGGWAAATRRRL